MANRIDTHHHFVPEYFARALEDAGGDPSGWKIPEWTVESDQAFMREHSIGTSMLSLTAPGPTIVKGGAEAANLARKVNEHAASIRDQHPTKYGFFAAVPDLTDEKAALEEISYALDTLKADGVTLFTRYGHDNHYLGHPDFKRIWDELDARHAVIFVHPTSPVDATKVNAHLPLPAIDYPHETTRTAVDLILTGTMRAHRNCKIILSHAGGTLPYIVARAAQMVPILGAPCSSEAEFVEDAKAFYYDLALSGSDLTLGLLRKFAPPDHILYGSDYPYAPTSAIDWHTNSMDSCLEGEETEMINRGNALKLFPRLAKSG